MARRRLGTAGAGALAGASSPIEAVDQLGRSPYGSRLPAGSRDGATAERAIAETLLWNLRVLAGWLPARGAELVRVLAGWFEIANVDEHLSAMRGATADPPFRLGTLSTVWPQLRETGSPDEVRMVLAGSPWRDPGGATVRDIQLGMRLSWAERVAARALPARPWAAGAVAILLAREHILRGAPLPPVAAATARRLIGPDATYRTSLPDLVAALPPRARWVLEGVGRPSDLWRAEARWWRRLRTDGAALATRSGFGPDGVVGAAALLAADAWLARGAVEAAAHGPAGVEVFDALA
jgi:hypothetical protein